VDVLDARNQLVGKQKDGLEGEFAVAEVEQILQTRSKEVEDHGIVVTFSAKPANKGDSDASSKGLVDTGFIFELRVLCLDALELDGDFLA
jgi:hypothetical protein